MQRRIEVVVGELGRVGGMENSEEPVVSMHHDGRYWKK